MKIVVALVLFLAGAARAEETLVLGELTGEGDYTLSSQIVGGPNVRQSAHCRLAVNLKRDGTRLDFDFSYFECGGDVWNDAPFSVEVKGSEVFLVDEAGKATRKVGQVMADGSYRISFESHRSVKATDRVPGPSCGMSDGRFVSKTLDLAQKLNYVFNSTGDNAWSLQRSELGETAEQTMRQVYGCNYWSTEVRTTTRDLRATVAK